MLSSSIWMGDQKHTSPCQHVGTLTLILPLSTIHSPAQLLSFCSQVLIGMPALLSTEKLNYIKNKPFHALLLYMWNHPF